MSQPPPSDEEVAAVLDQQHCISYRWYAQHFGVPVDVAKQALQDFCRSRSGEVYAIYLISGTCSAGRQTFKLVHESELESARSGFSEVRAEHVYSVTAPKLASGDLLWSLSSEQDSKLYKQLPTKANCLLDNRWSAVKFSAALVEHKEGTPGASQPSAPAPPARGHTSGGAGAPTSAPAAEAPALPAKLAAKKDPAAAASAAAALAPAAAAAPQRESAAAAHSSGEGKERVPPSSSRDEGARPPPKRAPPPAGKGGVAAMFAAQAARGATAKKGQPEAKQAAVNNGKEAPAPAGPANATLATGGDAAREPLSNVDNKKSADTDTAMAPPAKKQCVKAQDAPADSSKAVSLSPADASAAEVASNAEEEAAPSTEAAADGAPKAAEVDVNEPSAQGPGSSGGVARAESGGQKFRKKTKVAGRSLLDKPSPSPRSPVAAEAGHAKTPPATSAAESAEVESEVRPRTHIVKERVREEHTYMDDRGYMITEQVVVERDVEKELPAAATLPPKQAPAVKPGPALSDPSSDAAGARKKKAKGDKPQALQGSITSFFAKK